MESGWTNNTTKASYAESTMFAGTVYTDLDLTGFSMQNNLVGYWAAIGY
jgi:hypothetical protein